LIEAAFAAVINAHANNLSMFGLVKTQIVFIVQHQWI